MQSLCTDSTGQGIAVLNAGNESLLYNVVLENLSAPAQHGWELTGAITFYESPVKIDHCQFLDNKAGDDMLNIIRSEFEIRDSLFKSALFDALDVDFGKGKISNTSFVDCGNDGMDFSGSVIDVTGSFVNTAGDKGISVGENSVVNISLQDILNCYIAIASKDISAVSVKDTEISTSEFGLAVYQKKTEFGPSAITGFNINMVDVATPYLVEDDSTLLIDNNRIDITKDNVYEILYNE